MARQLRQAVGLPERDGLLVRVVEDGGPADQAGLSRLFGGIHVRADDLNGRRIGSLCGLEAWETAQRYYDGSARA